MGELYQSIRSVMIYVCVRIYIYENVIRKLTALHTNLKIIQISLNKHPKGEAGLQASNANVREAEAEESLISRLDLNKQISFIQNSFLSGFINTFSCREEFSLRESVTPSPAQLIL